jgi:hypothetical protein
MFFEDLFHGGLIAVHEALGAAEALDAVEIVIERMRGGDEVIQGHILVAFQYFRQAGGIGAGQGDLVDEPAFDILIQAAHFRLGKRKEPDWRQGSGRIPWISYFT